MLCKGHSNARKEYINITHITHCWPVRLLSGRVSPMGTGLKGPPLTNIINRILCVPGRLQVFYRAHRRIGYDTEVARNTQRYRVLILVRNLKQNTQRTERSGRVQL